MATTWTKDENEVEWISDERGNKCSVAYFGTKEKAEEALRSLENCDNCVNCSYCSDCSDCRYCSDCSYCRSCSDCSDCSSCRSCSYCRYCSDCRSCSSCRSCRSCSYCRYCSDCSYCRSCSYCSSCSDCSDCSDCRYCSYCSDCSDCSYCSDCRGDEKKQEPKVEIPKIANIHSTIYQAASAPGALDMGAVHVCETTHCRAGWVVTKAGEAGAKLEQRFGWLLAAMMIYRESGYQINPNKFFDSDAVAMDDMRKLAEEEAAATAGV